MELKKETVAYAVGGSRIAHAVSSISIRDVFEYQGTVARKRVLSSILDRGFDG